MPSWFSDFSLVLPRLHFVWREGHRHGTAPIFIAAEKGQVAVVRALHELGGDVNQAAADGTTHILIAAQRGQVAAVRALHELGVLKPETAEEKEDEDQLSDDEWEEIVQERRTSSTFRCLFIL